METTLKDQFITLWDTYFPQAGLPIHLNTRQIHRIFR